MSTLQFGAEPFETAPDAYAGSAAGTSPCRHCGQMAREDALDEYEAFDMEAPEDPEVGQRYGDLLLEAEPYEEMETRRIGDLDLEEADALQQREYEIIPPDSRVRVHRTTVAPFRYVCNLEYDITGVGRRSICSGTLIGPRTVLTAGHCLFGLSPSRMRVIPGRNGSLEPLAATAASRFILPPSYQSASPTDYGIIHLADAIGTAVGYWSSSHRTRPGDPVGTSILARSLPLPAGTLKVNLSGYPADRPFGSKFGCTDRGQPRQRCRISRLGDPKRNRLCGTFQYRAYNRTVLLRAGMLHYLNDTCPGHSGSPVWVKRHSSKGGRVLVAVHVAADDGIGVVANRSVFISSAVRQFIVANTV